MHFCPPLNLIMLPLLPRELYDACLGGGGGGGEKKYKGREGSMIEGVGTKRMEGRKGEGRGQQKW